MNITESQNKAVGEFVDLVATKTSSGGRAVHPETAISSLASVAGSLLLRSFNLRMESIEPGTVVLSNEANEKGPQLIDIMSAFLINAGVQLDKSLLGGEKAQCGEAPQLSVLNALSLLQSEALDIAKRNQLSLEQAAQSAAMATAFVVKECAPNLRAEIGFNVAAFAFVAGSKTAPPTLAQGVTPSLKKPWYKLW